MYSPSFSFFLSPFFLSLFTKQWHVAGLTFALHPFPPNQMHRNLTQSTLGISWHVISSTFSFPRFLFPSTSFLSLSFSTPVPFFSPHTPSNIHFQNHSASMTEVTWLRGQHRVTFASPQHFQTQWRGRMSRGSECLQNHSWYICLNHLGDKIHHVCSGFHLVGLYSVQPPKAHRSGNNITNRNISTDCFSRLFEIIETWDIFFLQGVLFVVRGRCFVHFVWASAVAYPDDVKTCILPVSWLTLFYITSCRVKCLVNHHMYPTR